MTEDGMISLGTIKPPSTKEALEKVEKAYKDVRGTTIEEFGANNDFDIGTDDMSWF